MTSRPTDDDMDKMLTAFYRVFRNGIEPIDPQRRRQDREQLRKSIDAMMREQEIIAAGQEVSDASKR